VLGMGGSSLTPEVLNQPIRSDKGLQVHIITRPSRAVAAFDAVSPQPRCASWPPGRHHDRDAGLLATTGISRATRGPSPDKASNASPSPTRAASRPSALRPLPQTFPARPTWEALHRLTYVGLVPAALLRLDISPLLGTLASGRPDPGRQRRQPGARPGCRHGRAGAARPR
jgi:hypothetical protein